MGRRACGLGGRDHADGGAGRASARRHESGRCPGVMLCWGFAGFEPLSPRALRSAEIHNLALEHGAFSRAPTTLNGPQQRDPRFLAPAESAEQLAADRG